VHPVGRAYGKVVDSAEKLLDLNQARRHRAARKLPVAVTTSDALGEDQIVRLEAEGDRATVPPDSSRNLGFELEVDFSAGEDFRVVQLTPPGSTCSIALMRSAERAGSLEGLHLVVADADTALAELQGRGVEATGPLHFADGKQLSGPDPERRDYNTFLSFEDPDGNGWLVQEVGRGATD